MAHKLRAALTMLGIVIGVAAVLTTVGIGRGAAQNITQQIQSQGTNLLVILPGSSNSGGVSQGGGSAQTLTMADVTALENSSLNPALGTIAPVYSGNTVLLYGATNTRNTIIGTTADYAATRNLDVAEGDFLTSQQVEQQQAVVVLGATLASDLFGSADPLNQIVSINGQPFRSATIDYQSAKAAYDEATAPPTAADIASAKAAIVDAQDKLDQLLAGPNQASQRANEITVQQAQLSLQTAQADLAQAVLHAPISGTVLAENVQVGQMVSAGTEAVTLGDLGTLELIMDVAEVDVARIAVGQPAQISIDALPGKTFDGTVERIDPSSTSVSGVVDYAVTTGFTGSDLSQIRPGMTAVATIVNQQESSGWLVPQDAVHKGADGSYVLAVENGQQTQVNVTTGPTDGEWIVVFSPNLQAGAEVVGSVTSPATQSGATPAGRGGFNGFQNLRPGAGGARRPGD